MSVQRFLFNIPADDIEQTAGFYTELFGFEIIFRNADWYIQLASPGNTAVQFGIIRRNSLFSCLCSALFSRSRLMMLTQFTRR
jgi:hypothetical protein